MTIAPGGHVAEAEVGASLLEAAMRAGLSLPSSCRNGTCRACMCRLIAGEVGYRIDWPGLTAEEKAEGWTLPCVALAQSDVTIDQPDAKPTAAAPRAVRSRGF
ncbi:2Fe-2S iron-sulfur cluster-binding protein [Caballeronia sp. LZ019]|nr:MULTISPECIES: 2Fe-2S iron-sulfur cluster-binding protein [unclassified Caballeronia]MDR5738682.1 2Fe-2S iron-sulfur cluster-binding protein [Caballeronia sp. LZ016]MDR5811449.1 2Fe-2S iron-sulfur cluster-binding protein [Caballeronia sp. LZ019]